VAGSKRQLTKRAVFNTTTTTQDKARSVTFYQHSYKIQSATAFNDKTAIIFVNNIQPLGY